MAALFVCRLGSALAGKPGLLVLLHTLTIRNPALLDGSDGGHLGVTETSPQFACCLSKGAGELTVTAVKLKNLTAGELILDPRNLRGRWQTATFQHNLLLPQGSLRDTTAAYLISTAPFEEVMGGY